MSAHRYVNLPENAGPVSEAAFYHRPTRTLVATDAVVFVPTAPPPIFNTYFDERSVGDPDFWAKSVLQAVFLPLRNGDGAAPEQRWPGYGSVNGRLLRAPILRAFADARAPDAVRRWVKETEAMGAFDRILTAHFASPIKASPAEFAAVFSYTIFLYCICSAAAFIDSALTADRRRDAFPATGGIIGGGCCGSSPTSSSSSSSSWSSSLT